MGAAWDTFDPDRTRSIDVARLLGYTHRGIVHYRSPESGEIEAGLAARWEQPDPLTLVLHLAPASWQGSVGHPERPVGPGDLRVHIERNRDGDAASFPRTASYAHVERVETPDVQTVRLRFGRPDPFFLETLAGPFARVQRPEVALELAAGAGLAPALVLGTGRFRLASFSSSEGYALERSDPADASAVPAPPWLDGIRAVAGPSTFERLRSAFEAKELDALALPRRFAASSLGPVAAGTAVLANAPSLMPLGGSYASSSPPWNDPRLIGGVFRALDRRRILEGMFPGAWSLSGNVPPPQAAWAFPAHELTTMPGYLKDRAQDASEAVALWSAAGGAGLGTRTIDIPDVVQAQFPAFGATVAANLSEVLGGSWDVRPEPYATIARRMQERAYGSGANRLWLGFLSPVASPDPATDLYDLYNSRGRGLAGGAVARIDELTARAISEFDREARRALCREAALAIHEHWGAGYLYLGVEELLSVRWAYVVAPPPSAFVNSLNTWREVSLDPGDASFQGRPPV